MGRTGGWGGWARVRGYSGVLVFLFYIRAMELKKREGSRCEGSRREDSMCEGSRRQSNRREDSKREGSRSEGSRKEGNRYSTVLVCLCYVRPMELTKRSVNGERFRGKFERTDRGRSMKGCNGWLDPGNRKSADHWPVFDVATSLVLM